MWVGWRWKERKRMGFSFGGDGLGREGEEEDLEGVIPQGPSGNSIGFWFPSQRKLNFTKSEKLFCKNKFMMSQKQFSLYANFNFPSSSSPHPFLIREKKEKSMMRYPLLFSYFTTLPPSISSPH